MTLVIKELRQELLTGQKRGFVLSAVIQCESKKKTRIRDDSNLLKQCRVPTVSLLEHIGSGKG